MRLRIDVDPPTFDRLVQIAERDRRPIPWQAAVLLRDAVHARAVLDSATAEDLAAIFNFLREIARRAQEQRGQAEVTR